MAQMYDHVLEIVHGGHAGPLVKNRPIASTARANAYAGRVVTINADGNFVLGNGGNLNAVPLILIRGVESPSVYTPVTGGDRFVPGTGAGAAAPAVVCTAGYELQTTEYNTTATYAVNTPLTANSSGVITPAPNGVYKDWIIGFASVHELAPNNVASFNTLQPPLGRNVHGRTTLTFWTWFLPGAEQGSGSGGGQGGGGGG